MVPSDSPADPPLSRRRTLVRSLRDAIWSMHGREDMERVLTELRQGMLDLGLPILHCGVNIVDRSVSPPTVVSHSMDPSGTWNRLETGAPTIVEFWEGRRVVYRRDLHRDDRYDEHRYMGSIRTVIDVPFAQGTLAASSQRPDAFTERDIDLLEEMAGLLEDGFRRLEQIERVETRLRVREKVWQMRATTDIEEVAVALREAFDEFGFPYSSCGLNIVHLDHIERGEHVIMSHAMTRGAGWVTLDRQPNPLVVQFWRGGEPVYRRDLDADDPYGEQALISEYYGKPARSIIDVPFSHGTLALNSTEPDAFSDEQIELLQDLAGVLEEGFRRLDDLKALEDRTAHLEAEVEERRRTEQSLARSLEEKEVLLREVHHRVKNNLQVVCSILSLRSGGLRDDEAIRVFDDSRAQIESMALIHERLYGTEDLGRIDGQLFVRDLCAGVFGSYGVDERIGLELEVEPETVTVEVAIECGLIVHELVANGLKHAFPEQRTGTIRVEARRDTDQVCLTVRDDGVGLPVPLPPGDSIGLRLVQDLTTKLGGTLQSGNDVGGGASFHVRFPARRPAASD